MYNCHWGLKAAVNRAVVAGMLKLNLALFVIRLYSAMDIYVQKRV